MSTAANALRSITRSPAVAKALSAGPVARFSGSVGLRSGKEDELHNEDRAERVEKKKQEQLKSKGKAEWADGLASNSESIVKAERGETKSTDEHIKELQNEAQQVGKQ